MNRKLWGLLLLAGLSCSAQGQDSNPGFYLEGSVSRCIPVTRMKMTNLVFPVAIAAGVKVSRDVLVQKPKGIENVIELNAVRRNFRSTNLSVYGVDGRLYSFELRYVEDTSVLNYRVVPDGMGRLTNAEDHPVILSGLPVDLTTLDKDATFLAGKSGVLHSSVRSGGMGMWLKGIYLRDSLLWLSLRLTNLTAIGFTPAYIRVFVEDRRQVKRTASQQLEIQPVYMGGLDAVTGKSRRELSLGFVPFTLARGKRLVIEMADANGGRQLLLKVRGKMLLRAMTSL